jgi:hypothetical protein
MDTPHEHTFDGKEDRNYHQKPFDDNTDPLPQIDDASAALHTRQKSGRYGDPDAAGKGQIVPGEALPDDARAEFTQDDEAVPDRQRIAQYKDRSE